MNRSSDPTLASFPVLSIKERDRRWTEIRKRMRQENIDALLIWGNNRHMGFGMANFRYVTSIGCMDGTAFFPLEGEPVAFADSSHQYHPFNYFAELQNWVPDVRPQTGARGLTEIMHSRNIVKARVGYVDRASLLGLFTMPYPVITKLKEEFPGVEFFDATRILDEVRMIKSEEEIEYLRRSGKIARDMATTMFETAKPGLKECNVYSAMMKVMIDNGGEDCAPIFMTSDNINGVKPFLLHGRMAPWAPSTRLLANGDVILCELHASYGGYLTQTERTFHIGQPPQELRAINDVAIESFKNGLSNMRPGVVITDAADAFLKPVQEAGLDYIELGFHGHGLGSPEYPTCIRPLSSPGDYGQNLRLQKNMVFASNIDIHNPKWKKDVGLMFCDTFVIKDGAPERLVNLDPLLS